MLRQHKATSVVEAVEKFYTTQCRYCRGVHTLAQEATDLYEAARAKSGEIYPCSQYKSALYAWNNNQLELGGTSSHQIDFKGTRIWIGPAEIIQCGALATSGQVNGSILHYFINQRGQVDLEGGR